MKTGFAEVVAAVRDVLRTTFVTPVREGRPHPANWPNGLREVGAATAIVFGLLAVAILFAEPLRRTGELVLDPSTGDGVPQLVLPLLLTGLLLSFALLVTAALHTSWWLRLLLLLIGAAAVFLFTGQTWTDPAMMAVAVLGYLAVAGFATVRAFRRPAWWEFVVVAGLLMVAMLAPWSRPLAGAGFGFDLRPAALHGALVSLQYLVLPTMMVAGSAPAQIVVTGAQAAAGRPVGRGLFWTGFGLAVAGLGVATALEADGRELALAALAASGLLLALAGTVVGALVWRARVRVPPPPHAYPDVWGHWLYPLSASVVAIVALTLPVLILRALLQLLGLAGPADALTAVWTAFTDSNPAMLWRAALGLVTLVLAWRLSGSGRLAEAVPLGVFSVLVLGDAAGNLPALELLLDRTSTAFGALAAALALFAFAVLAAGGRLDRSRAVGVMTVVLLALLYPHRNALENPAGLVLALTPSVLLVFGIAWRVATEAGFTDGGSPRYPQSTRILLLLANALFATTGVAYVALTRAAGSDIDVSVWGELGDAVLGEPLFVAGLVTGLWLVLRPSAASAGLDDPRPAA